MPLAALAAGEVDVGPDAGVDVGLVDDGDGFPILERVRPATPDALDAFGGAFGARPFSRIVVARARSFSPSIADPEFDNLFVVVVPDRGKARLVRLRYGSQP